MPVVPSSVSLEIVEDGSSIIASEHRNNYSAVQTAVNGLVAVLQEANAKGDLLVATAADTWVRLPVGANGLVVTADSVEASGMKWATVGGAYARRTATVDVVSSAAELSLYDGTAASGTTGFAIAANDMSTNKMLRLTMAGDILYNNVDSNTLTLKVKFGGTTFLHDITNGSLVATRQPWKMVVEVMNLGASNSQWVDAVFLMPRVNAPAPTAGIGEWSFLELDTTSRNTPTGGVLGIPTLGTIDTTAQRFLDVTAQWSASSANNSFRCRRAILELV